MPDKNDAAAKERAEQVIAKAKAAAAEAKSPAKDAPTLAVESHQNLSIAGQFLTPGWKGDLPNTAEVQDAIAAGALSLKA
ncbi:MAG TPA: hypothetical protein VF244_01610 [Acidimicrobiales bacterium]